MTDEIPQCLLCGEAGIAGVLNICGDCYDKKIKRNDCQGEGPEFVERAEIARLREQLTEAREIIGDCQSILARYLPPGSGIAPQQCISDLLGILDGPRARAFLKGETDNG